MRRLGLRLPAIVIALLGVVLIGIGLVGGRTEAAIAGVIALVAAGVRFLIR
jgi:hypothetical protein